MKEYHKIEFRPQRLRQNSSIRRLVQETNLNKNNLIYPLFIREGTKIKDEIPSMPGIYHFSTDTILYEIEKLLSIGLDHVILFGIPNKKDAIGSNAFSDNGIIQKTTQKIKSNFPEMYLISDICMCGYTNHGHCGIIENEKINNDKTLTFLQKQSISHANAGIDMVAPSAMMDGMVKAIRKNLNNGGYQNIPIMSYSTKYASAFYGPFRNAAKSKPEFGDRKSYQMDPANSKEAIKEVSIDIAEGADIIMIKPAMIYLDIINKIKNISPLPIAAYNVSGEYSMIKAASEKGWIDEKTTRNELLLSIKRAGADIIITYFAKEFIIDNNI